MQLPSITFNTENVFNYILQGFSLTGGKRKAGVEGLRVGGRKGKTSTISGSGSGSGYGSGSGISASGSYGSILPTSIEGSDEGDFD